MEIKKSQVSQWFDLYMPSKSDVVERTLSKAQREWEYWFSFSHY